MLIKPVKYFKRIRRDVFARDCMFRPGDDSRFWINFLFGEKTVEKLLNNGNGPLNDKTGCLYASLLDFRLCVYNRLIC